MLRMLLMNNDRFKVINNIKLFIKYVDNIIVNYPRCSFNLKNRLENTCYDVLELLFLANIIKDGQLYQRQIISKINMLDFYLELSYDKKYISLKALNKGIRQLDTISKMILGWAKNNNEC